MTNFIRIVCCVVLLFGVFSIHGQGVVQVQSGSTTIGGSLNADGTGVTNVWIRQILTWRTQGTTFTALTPLFIPLNSISSPNAIENINQMLMPTNGYLSNLVCATYTIFPAFSSGNGSNIVFTILTNKYGSAGVASQLTCTLLGGQTIELTNDSTHSVILTPNICADLQITWSTNITSAPFSGSVEWWHQSP